MSISTKNKDVSESKHQPTIPETSSFLDLIRRQLCSLKFTHRCKTTQVHALNPAPDHHLTINYILSNPNDDVVSTRIAKSFLPYGLPTTHLLEPAIDPHLNPVDFVDSLSSIYRRIQTTSDDDASNPSKVAENKSPSSELKAISFEMEFERKVRERKEGEDLAEGKGEGDEEEGKEGDAGVERGRVRWQRTEASSPSKVAENKNPKQTQPRSNSTHKPLSQPSVSHRSRPDPYHPPPTPSWPLYFNPAAVLSLRDVWPPWRMKGRRKGFNI